MSGIDSSAPASPDSSLLVNFSVTRCRRRATAAVLRRNRARPLDDGPHPARLRSAGRSRRTSPISSSRPQARTNYSELITPTRPIPASAAAGRSRRQRGRAALAAGQWLVVVVAGGACDARCERHLWLQRQLHAALGAQQGRVDKVWLVDDDAPPRAETLRAIARPPTPDDGSRRRRARATPRARSPAGSPPRRVTRSRTTSTSSIRAATG
jgi:hypothetical protein